MNAELLWLGIAVAAAAAVRSTWSPCGHSMLTKINPMGEASRGNRFGVTAVWFVAGAVAGGFTLGLGAAVLAVLVGLAQLPTSAVFGATAVLALLAATVDTRLFGFGPPFHRRQVNDTWIGRYRSGVYALGFGWQLGVGVSTYVMTAAVFLTVAFAALTGSVLAALVIGIAYGSVRGLALFIGARVSSPATLRSLLARFERAGEPVRRAVIAVQFAVAAVAAYAAGAMLGVLAVALLITLESIVGAARSRGWRPRPAPSSPISSSTG
ncbi:MAG: hypothetical protein ACXW2C_07385 [Acidimicrobiia bacterium]